MRSDRPRYRFTNLELQFMSDKIDADAAVQSSLIRLLHGRPRGGTIGAPTPDVQGPSDRDLGSLTPPINQDTSSCETPNSTSVAPPSGGMSRT